MKVLKFGGTSLGSAQRMKNIAKIVNQQEKVIVVLSAVSGTTDTLLSIFAAIRDRNIEQAEADTKADDESTKQAEADANAEEESTKQAEAAAKAEEVAAQAAEEVTEEASNEEE